jgi:hypothetical protein
MQIDSVTAMLHKQHPQCKRRIAFEIAKVSYARFAKGGLSAFSKGLYKYILHQFDDKCVTSNIFSTAADMSAAVHA